MVHRDTIQNTPRTLAILLALLPGAWLASSCGGGDDSHAQEHAHWGYEGAAGPGHWGDLEGNEVCSAGKAQSPIDIKAPAPGELAALEFSYKKVPLALTNNGHTIVVDGTGVGSAVLAGKSYELLQFHFHAPSEHHVEGSSFPMEIHFVHKSADGAYGVLGVLVSEGAQNGPLQSLWSHLPKEEGGKSAPAGVQFDPATLLPAKRDYYHYAGSLTTPPCTEGLSWNVLTTPIEASAKQVAALRELFGSNARPIQPLNGRPVEIGG